LFHALGIDRAVGYLLVGYGWNFVAQPITLLMIVTFLNPREQDFYYTFGSIIGIQPFFELGMVAAVQQFASHEAGHLHWTDDRTMSGDPAAKSRLASLFQQAAGCYAAITVLVAAVLLPVGWMILRKGGDEVAWKLAWIFAASVAAASMLPTPAMIILSGTGRIADALRATTIQRVFFNVTQWVVLAAGGRLLSWPVAQFAGLGFLISWLTIFWLPTFRDLWRYPPGGPVVHWWRDVWPFQWKVGLSTPMIYLTSQIFTPILFWYAEDGAAGRMGLSLNAANALAGAASAWVLSRMPQFGALIARREWGKLDDLFGRSYRQSIMVLAPVSFIVWAIAAVLNGATGTWVGPGLLRIGDRFLPPVPLGMVLLGGLVQHCGLMMACYLRAHRRDPYAKVFIALGAVTAVVALAVGRAGGGTLGLAAVFLALNVVFHLGWGVAIFRHARHRWHDDDDLPTGDISVTAAP
jgi:hypothetical protein